MIYDVQVSALGLPRLAIVIIDVRDPVLSLRFAYNSLIMATGSALALVKTAATTRNRSNLVQALPASVKTGKVTVAPGRMTTRCMFLQSWAL